MNYKIIKDEEKFKEFIDWLPELADGEQYYISLFARAKYDKTDVLKSDKSQLARTTASKKWMYEKVKKLETELGTYKIDDKPIPDDTMVVYIHTNPRSIRKASLKTAKMILDDIEYDRISNPKSTALNALQVSKSRMVWFDFDIDVEKNDENKDLIITTAMNALETMHFRIVETHGGYHLLVDNTKIDESKKKSWYNGIVNSELNIDQKGDLMMPVVGCCQGDFTPKFIF